MALQVSADGNYLIGLKAGESLASNQYCFAKQDTDFEILAATANSSKICGIIQNDPASGENVSVKIAGVSFLKVAGTTSEGDALTSDSEGLGVVTTSAGHEVGAQALEDGAANEVISVLITRYRY